MTLRVKVRHRIGKLAADYAEIAVEAPARMHRVVRENVKFGEDLARAHAREHSGIHGKHYYKRITSEMVGDLTGEYGPSAPKGGPYVGAGYRHGAGNRDLPASADKVLPAAAADVRKMITRLFS